jgi:hypothetical protein
MKQYVQTIATIMEFAIRKLEAVFVIFHTEDQIAQNIVRTFVVFMGFI